MTYYRRNKYNSRKTIYNGIKYDSKLEAEYAQQLDIRKRDGDIKDWRRQEPIKLEVNGKKIATYKVDFVITHNDNAEEYIEIKGMRTAVFNLKWKLFEALYPDIKKTILTRNDI